MRIVHTILTVIIALALVVLALNSERKEQDLAHEILVLTDANDGLRNTLGDLTIAITQKEKQIDDLRSLPCKDTPEAKPEFALPSKPSNAIRKPTGQSLD